MTATMTLEILTPDEKILESPVKSMRVLLSDGWWGILPGHAPMISYIKSGIVFYKTPEDADRFVALYQGTVEVQHIPQAESHVRILTSAAAAGDDLEKVEKELIEQAAKLEEAAREANLEFNQIKLSLEKSLQNSEIMIGQQ